LPYQVLHALPLRSPTGCSATSSAPSGSAWARASTCTAPVVLLQCRGPSMMLSFSAESHAILSLLGYHTIMLMLVTPPDHRRSGHEYKQRPTVSPAFRLDLPKAYLTLAGGSQRWRARQPGPHTARSLSSLLTCPDNGPTSLCNRRRTPRYDGGASADALDGYIGYAA
jgi:hypothetical protein